MKALVTGAAGLIGANLVRTLLRGGHQVRAFVRAASDRRSLDGLAVEIHCGDVLDLESLCSAARDCDVLFHAAAIFSYEGTHVAELEHLAVEGTINAIHAAHSAKVRRVVLTSSSVVFGSSNRPLIRNEQDQPDGRDPVPYIMAKQAQEHAAFEHAESLGVKLVAVCPTLTVRGSSLPLPASLSPDDPVPSRNSSPLALSPADCAPVSRRFPTPAARVRSESAASPQGLCLLPAHPSCASPRFGRYWPCPYKTPAAAALRPCGVRQQTQPDALLQVAGDHSPQALDSCFGFPP